MDENDIVRVIYKGREIFHGTRDPRTGQELSGGWDLDDVNPWTVEWDSRKYDLFPGRDAFIPFSAMCCAFGDPRSTDKVKSYRDQHGVVGFIPDRATEIRRLRTKYDNMFGDESVVVHHPHVSVFDLNGEPITTVLDDPEGRTTIPAVQTVSQNDELLDIVKRQQLTINKLMETVGIDQPKQVVNEPNEPAPAPAPVPVDEAPDDVPEDTAYPPLSEQMTGERGGRAAGEPALDFSTMQPKSAAEYGPES